MSTLVENLTVLAGGKGHVVQEAIIHSKPEGKGTTLPAVVLYIVEWRLEHDELPAALRTLLRDIHKEWRDLDKARKA